MTNPGCSGISGVSSDMRKVLEAMKSGNSEQRWPSRIFVHRLRSCIGSMVAVLGGVDVLIFTAGIGENSAAVREAACAGFGFLRLRLDPAANDRSPMDQDIAARDSAVRVLRHSRPGRLGHRWDCWKICSRMARFVSRRVRDGKLNARSRLRAFPIRPFSLSSILAACPPHHLAEKTIAAATSHPAAYVGSAFHRKVAECIRPIQENTAATRHQIAARPKLRSIASVISAVTTKSQGTGNPLPKPCTEDQ